LTNTTKYCRIRKASKYHLTSLSNPNSIGATIRAKYIVINGIRVARDFEPETFGRLTTIGPRFRIGSKSFQVCQCNCGTIGVYQCEHMNRGGTSSCGCYANERRKKRFTVHGEANRTPENRAWAKMRKRCYDTKCLDYPNYGGRGIKVCDRWLEPDGRGYMNFLEDMGRKPSTEHSIDRIDNEGNYEPENCRWATRIEQALNKRNTVFITAFGRTKTLFEFANEYGIGYRLLYDRLYKGWDTERAITEPKREP